MEHIWSPWRFKYLIGVAGGPSPDTLCVFCDLPQQQADEKNYIVHRAQKNFVILNLFPYTSGHLMVVPYQHTPTLAELDQQTTTEMMELTKIAQRALEAEYKPHGFNIGLNLGAAAGAGVAGHIHLHVVPRWTGDANFVSVIAETRVLPEELHETHVRLKKHFDANACC